MIISSIFILCVIAVTSMSDALYVTNTELDALRNECTEKKKRDTRMDWNVSGVLPTIDYCKLDASASDGNAVMFDVRFGPFNLKPGMAGEEMLLTHGYFPFPPDVIHPDGKVRVSASRAEVEYLNGTLAPTPPIHIHHVLQGVVPETIDKTEINIMSVTDSRCNPIEEDADSCKWRLMEAGYSAIVHRGNVGIVLEHLGEKDSTPAMELAVHISIRLMTPAKKKEQETVGTVNLNLFQSYAIWNAENRSISSSPEQSFQRTKNVQFTAAPMHEGTSILIGYRKFPVATRIVPYHYWHSHHYSNGGFVFLGDIKRKGIGKLRKVRSSEDVARLMNDTTTAADVRLLCEYGHNSPGSPNRRDFLALPQPNCALDSAFDVPASEVITTLCINYVTLNGDEPVNQHCLLSTHYVHLPISKKEKNKTRRFR